MHTSTVDTETAGAGVGAGVETGVGVGAGAGEGDATSFTGAASFATTFLTSPVEVMPAMRVDVDADGVAPGVELVLGGRIPVDTGTLAAVEGALGAVTDFVTL